MTNTFRAGAWVTAGTILVWGLSQDPLEKEKSFKSHFSTFNSDGNVHDNETCHRACNI